MERIPPRVGPKPADFDETQTNASRAVVATCCAVVVITIILRTLGRYALRLKMNHKYNSAGHYLGLDDIFNFLAVLSFTGLAIAILISIERGMGVHISRIIWLHGSDGFDNYTLTIYFCAIFYNATLGMVKLSVLALYRRILQGLPSRKLTIANYTLAGVVSLNTIANVSIAVFQCNPIHAAWDSRIADKTCVNLPAFYLANASTGIATDTLVYLMSIPIIKPLQIDQKKKLQIMVTLLIGLLAVITSCIRIGFIPDLLVNPDASWAMAVPLNWSIVEPTVGILVSSLPAIRSTQYFRSTTFSSSQNSFDTSLRRLNLDPTQSGEHIQLQDYRGAENGEFKPNRATIEGGRKKEVEDGDSEKGLTFPGTNRLAIAKTTEITVALRAAGYEAAVLKRMETSPINTSDRSAGHVRQFQRIMSPEKSLPLPWSGFL